MSATPLQLAMRRIVEDGREFDADQAVGLLRSAGFVILPISGPEFDAAVERAARAFWGVRFNRAGTWPTPSDTQWRDFQFALRVFTGEIR